MIKFYGNKKRFGDKEIKKAYLVKETENGFEKIEILGIIGKVIDLVLSGIISAEDGEMDKYLSITKDGCIIDVSDTLQEAADKFRLWYIA